jgi:hypothetical protein
VLVADVLTNSCSVLISLRLRGLIEEEDVVSLIPVIRSDSEEGGKSRGVLVMPALDEEEEGSMVWLVCGPSASETYDHERELGRTS